MSHGRKVIYTDFDTVTRDNVLQLVNTAMLTHLDNRNDIQKLYNYWRGKTPIMNKTKEVREEINHKICENRAYEVERFFQGYVFGEAIQYVRRETPPAEAGDDEISADINALNGYMADVSKPSVDNELAEWLYVSGTSYRVVLPNENWTQDSDEPPFETYSMDPRNTFVVYHSGYRHQPVFAVNYVNLQNGQTLFKVFTKDRVFTFADGIGADIPKTVMEEPMRIPNDIEEQPIDLGGDIPIIEYPADSPRLGVFEVVLDLLDAINELQSNRMDDIVQFVNQFLAILGGTIEESDWAKVNENKLICVPDGVDAKYIGAAMKNTDVQVLKEDLYMAILTICGIPNRSGGVGVSSNDTGAARQLANGWQTAESRAKATETMFKKSEKVFLRIVLNILRRTVGTRLKLHDIEAHFTRRNYENILSKAQVLTTMLDNGKIAPELAFTSSGMFIDPEAAYLQSKQYIEDQQAKGISVYDNTGENQVSALPQDADGAGRQSENALSEMQSVIGRRHDQS